MAQGSRLKLESLVTVLNHMLVKLQLIITKSSIAAKSKLRLQTESQKSNWYRSELNWIEDQRTNHISRIEHCLARSESRTLIALDQFRELQCFANSTRSDAAAVVAISYERAFGVVFIFVAVEDCGGNQIFGEKEWNSAHVWSFPSRVRMGPAHLSLPF